MADLDTNRNFVSGERKQESTISQSDVRAWVGTSDAVNHIHARDVRLGQ